MSLADKPGLGASLSCSPGALLCCLLQGRPLQRGYGTTTSMMSMKMQPLAWLMHIPWLVAAHLCHQHSLGSPGSHTTGTAGLRLAQRADTNTSRPCSSHFLLQLKNNLMASV